MRSWVVGSSLVKTAARRTSISLHWKEWTSERFRSGKQWNTRNTLGMSACGRPGSKSYRIPGANPQVGVEPVLGPPISLANHGERALPPLLQEWPTDLARRL